MSRRRLLFVSPQFLFPLDAGGKIRTANILRGMKGRAFEITLLSPAVAGNSDTWRDELDGVADRFVGWPDPTKGWRGKVQRLSSVLHPLPVTVAVDLSRAASALVRRELAQGYDVVVFDYVHAAIFKPTVCATPSVCLTHNVEAEILARHGSIDSRAYMRLLWQSQHGKMERFERAALAGFDVVVAISERDAQMFRDDYGLGNVRDIPTAVDLDFFPYEAPAAAIAEEPLVSFTGSMNSRANVNGIEWFIDRIWPRIAAAQPRAHCVVVGKNPPDSLVARARDAGHRIEFTGFVDDVRPHMRGADVSVIPLLVGGGTRIKAYEAMAMGIPIVSTTLGIEGLPVRDGEHLCLADEPDAFADRILELIGDPARRGRIAAAARQLVEENFGAARVARIFEDICRDAAGERHAAA